MSAEKSDWRQSNEFIKIAASSGECGIIPQDLAFSCNVWHFRAMSGIFVQCLAFSCNVWHFRATVPFSCKAPYIGEDDCIPVDLLVNPAPPVPAAARIAGRRKHRCRAWSPSFGDGESSL